MLAPSTLYMYRRQLRQLLTQVRDAPADSEERSVAKQEAAALVERLHKAGVEVTQTWLAGERPAPRSRAPVQPSAAALKTVETLAQRDTRADNALTEVEQEVAKHENYWSEQERAKRAQAVEEASREPQSSQG